MNPSSSFADCLSADQRALRAMARQLRQLYGAPRDALNREFTSLSEASRAKVAARLAALPRPQFNQDLPVNERRQEIAQLIAAHQVVIVCGETGSGKTTQLPKICLELQRGVHGLIGHTQPRRLAARATATRLAHELQSEVGQLVGYKVRFTDRTSPNAYIKLMTDGILLAESQGDPWLSQYDTLIIDEAHERSLNIDFLLGYLKGLLLKRPDLKLIITSATLDAERFATHFAINGKAAPVIEVSGRLYPVEVRYRPVQNEEAEDENERDLNDAIVDACDELQREGSGDILVFLPGEREIRDAAEALRKAALGRNELDILPLFARLSMEEQARIFRPSTTRRIVLATNVAETSLTVPGIHYVVDSGLVRVKRYSYRNKIEQLQVEKNAQASAKQRAGRCGRIASGVCIRLYDEADFAMRPLYTDPEILRSSLAGVILRMKSLRLGQIEDFPFLERPPARAISDGYQLLLELGAVTEERTLTKIGEELAKMPLDPRIARMIVAARDEGCLREILIIAAALSVQDPRERPPEKAGSADLAHKFFADEKSEFLSWLKLWDWYTQEQDNGKNGESASQKKIARACHEKFLSALRMREWRETHHQLAAIITEQGLRENQVAARYEAIHRALLTGLMGNIGSKSEDSGHYLGARAIKFLIHPSSALNKKAGKWIMAAEITETSKLFARCVAKIEPEWLEKVGVALIKRSYSDPHWEKKSMQTIAFERSTLYGLVINPKKRVGFGHIDPVLAREIFIRQGLIGGEIDAQYEKRWAFYRHNQQEVLEIETLEHKSRRPDVLVDDELIFAFYDRQIPAEICDGVSFDHWLRHAAPEVVAQLKLQRADLMRHEAAGITTEAFPHCIRLAGNVFTLSYHFDPGSSRDGVTLHLPLPQLNQLPLNACEWLVPGLLREKVIQLVKTLPQKIRAKLVPIPDFADEFIAKINASEKTPTSSLISALIDFILKERGLNARGWQITADAFRPDTLAPHLFFNFQLLDDDGRVVGQSRQLNELRQQWGQEARQEFSERHETPSEYSGMKDWRCGQLPELLEVTVGQGRDQQRVIGYPAFKDEGDSVSLTVFDTPEEAENVHAQGLLRLFMLQFGEQIKYFSKNMPGFNTMAMYYMALGSQDELRTQLIETTFRRACLNEPWPRDEAAFRQRCNEAKPRLGLLAQEICRLVTHILDEQQGIMKRLPQFKTHSDAFADIEKQLSQLIRKRFIVETPFERLAHFPRYLKAVSLRLDKLKADPQRDKRLLNDYRPLATNYERRVGQLAKQGIVDNTLVQFRWLLEELRVQLFAQELRTPTPISVKRLQKMWEGL